MYARVCGNVVFCWGIFGLLQSFRTAVLCEKVNEITVGRERLQEVCLTTEEHSAPRLTFLM